MLSGFGDAAQVERLRASIAAEHGVKLGYHDADVGVPSRIEDLVRAKERQLGPVDILVNNAVVRHYHAIEDFPPAEWDRAMAVDVSAAFHTIVSPYAAWSPYQRRGAADQRCMASGFMLPAGNSK